MYNSAKQCNNVKTLVYIAVHPTPHLPEHCVSMSIAVVAALKISAGKRDEFLQIFKQLAKYVRENEPETLAYQATYVTNFV